MDIYTITHVLENTSMRITLGSSQTLSAFLEVYLYKCYMLCEPYFAIQTCIQISRSVSVQVLHVSVCDGIIIMLTGSCFIILIFCG